MSGPVAESNQLPGQGAAAGGPAATSKGKVKAAALFAAPAPGHPAAGLKFPAATGGDRYIRNTFEIIFPSLSFLSSCLSSCSFSSSPPWEQCYRKL